MYIDKMIVGFILGIFFTVIVEIIIGKILSSK